MARAVLDASAVIALLRNEPGAEIVAAHIGEAVISAVNLQEVAKALVERGVPLAAAREMIDALRLEVSPHDEEDAYAAAALGETTRRFGSGLGDRSCLALAIRREAPAVTTDRAWLKLSIPGLEVKLAR